MANLSQKIPLAVSLANFTEQSVQEGLSGLGQVYPCTVKSVGIDGAGNTVVTVNFEINPVSSTGTKITLPEVTMPIAESKYVRLPVQVKDQGIAVAASVRIGGITGLGTGLAPLAPASNLGALVFLPVSNTAWTTLDPNAVVISASNGAIIRTDDGKAIVTISDNQIELQYGSTTLIANNSGVTITGNLVVHGSITGDNGFNISGGTGGTVNVTGNMNITGNTNQTGTIASTGDITAGSVTMETHTHRVVGVQGGTSTITTTVGAG